MALTSDAYSSESFLRQIHDVAIGCREGFLDEVEGLLELGRKEFGFEVGAVTEMHGGNIEILYTSGSERLAPGAVIANCDAFCAEVAIRGYPILIDDASSGEWADHPAHTKLGLNSYVGTPIRLSGGRKGSVCFLSWTKRPYPLGESIPDQSLLLSQRIESVLERLEVSEALRESEALFRATFEQASVGIALVGTDGSWLKVNQTLCDMLGYSESELLSLTFQDITHPGDLDKNLDLLSKALGKETDQYSMRKRYLTKHGESVWTNLTTRLLRDQKGNPLHFISIIEDISEQVRTEEARRRFEERVQEAQKLESLGVLAGGVAHDFNNLLTAIMGNAIMAKNAATGNATLQDQLKQIEAAAQHAADLTNQLLAYTGKGALVTQHVDLGDLIDEMQKLLHSVLSKRSKIEWIRPQDAMPTLADPTQLRQVIMNLLTNASEALKNETGTISIDVDQTVVNEVITESGWVVLPQPGDYIRLRVLDDGVGMNDEIQKRIFEPFFTRKFVGRGLGLSAVLGIIQRHSGGIRVSSAPDEGTTVTVLLPTDQSDTIADPELSTQEWKGSGTALVVDDEDHVRTTAQAMMAQLGFTDVVTAEDGKEAVDILQAQSFSIVLLDVTMPGASVDETFASIKKSAPTTPVILMSGYNEQLIAPILTQNGSTRFLKKPFTFNAMTECLQQLLPSC